MAKNSLLTKPWRLILPQGLYTALHNHLFPGDGDEHGAIITAGIAESNNEIRLLARSLHLAVDGLNYVPGKRGYRMLKADFIADHINSCAKESLVYLAVHNHGGTNQVEFSYDDLRSHERGYPALIDINNGNPVGALVFAKNAIAGDIWLPGEERISLTRATIVGESLRQLTSNVENRSVNRKERYDRQSRMFGDAGQDILSKCKVGIIGLGGVGSLLAEYLGRLGVGNFVLVDPERAEITNFPRLTAASHLDVMSWFTDGSRPEWLRKLGMRLSRKKVGLARRNILRANSKAHVEPIFGNFLEAEIAARFVDCDYLFLAADSMRARLLFNAIVHQYLIPGVQIGSKVRVDEETGDVLDVYSVVRPVSSESGCLLCNKLINSAKLQEESISDEDRRRQKYIDEPDIPAPSVITLNATVASQAANDFLFYMTGLRDLGASKAYIRLQPQMRETWQDEARRSISCTECGGGSNSRLARGNSRRLPVIERS